MGQIRAETANTKLDEVLPLAIWHDPVLHLLRNINITCHDLCYFFYVIKWWANFKLCRMCIGHLNGLATHGLRLPITFPCQILLSGYSVSCQIKVYFLLLNENYTECFIYLFSFGKTRLEQDLVLNCILSPPIPNRFFSFSIILVYFNSKSYMY